MDHSTDSCMDYVQRLAAVEESAKSAHKRLDEMSELSKSVRDLAASTKVMAAELSHIKEDAKTRDERISEELQSIKDTADERDQTVNKKLDDIQADVNEQKLKPAKRWETVVSQIIQLLVAGAVGYFISLLVSR